MGDPHRSNHIVLLYFSSAKPIDDQSTMFALMCLESGQIYDPMGYLAQIISDPDTRLLAYVMSHSFFRPEHAIPTSPKGDHPARLLQQSLYRAQLQVCVRFSFFSRLCFRFKVQGSGSPSGHLDRLDLKSFISLDTAYFMGFCKLLHRFKLQVQVGKKGLFSFSYSENRLLCGTAGIAWPFPVFFSPSSTKPFGTDADGWKRNRRLVPRIGGRGSLFVSGPASSPGVPVTVFTVVTGFRRVGVATRSTLSVAATKRCDRTRSASVNA